MKHNVMLTIASLLSILLLTFHLSGDIIRGMEKGGLSNLIAVPILVVWLYGTLVLAERRSGYIIILLGSLLAIGRPRHPHEGGGCWRAGRQGPQRSLLLRLDAHRARRDRALLRHPLSARTVEPAMGPGVNNVIFAHIASSYLFWNHRSDIWRGSGLIPQGFTAASHGGECICDIDAWPGHNRCVPGAHEITNDKCFRRRAHVLSGGHVMDDRPAPRRQTGHF